MKPSVCVCARVCVARRGAGAYVTIRLIALKYCIIFLKPVHNVALVMIKTHFSSWTCTFHFRRSGLCLASFFPKEKRTHFIQSTEAENNSSPPQQRTKCFMLTNDLSLAIAFKPFHVGSLIIILSGYLP